MPNPYFSFKQFTVYHDRCAMKVGTDGVLLGAWVDVVSARKSCVPFICLLCLAEHSLL